MHTCSIKSGWRICWYVFEREREREREKYLRVMPVVRLERRSRGMDREKCVCERKRERQSGEIEKWESK
jgi:hypothetical protein